MKQFVDINIEIVVGVAISFLVMESQIYTVSKIPGPGRTKSSVDKCWYLLIFFLSFHHIYTDHTIFYIEEKVSQQAAACDDLENDSWPASESWKKKFGQKYGNLRL